MWYDVGISDSHSPLSRLIIFLWSLPLQRAYQAAPTSECACRFPSPRKACQASVNPLVQRLVVRILTVAPKKLPIDYGGTAPSLYPAGGKRSTPPSVDYGGTAPALYPAGDNYGTPLAIITALRRRLITAARLPGLIRLIVTTAPRRQLTTPARLPRFIRLAVSAPPRRRLTTVARLLRFIRLAVTAASRHRRPRPLARGSCGC